MAIRRHVASGEWVGHIDIFGQRWSRETVAFNILWHYCLSWGLNDVNFANILFDFLAYSAKCMAKNISKLNHVANHLLETLIASVFGEIGPNFLQPYSDVEGEMVDNMVCVTNVMHIMLKWLQSSAADNINPDYIKRLSLTLWWQWRRWRGTRIWEIWNRIQFRIRMFLLWIWFESPRLKKMCSVPTALS